MVGDMSAYILEIKAIVLRGEGPVGYGVDEAGRQFEVALDLGLAADIARALDEGQRPIVAVEGIRGNRTDPAPRSLPTRPRQIERPASTGNDSWHELESWGFDRR